MSTTTEIETRWVETARGARCRVLCWGPEDGVPVVFLHAAVGLLPDHRFVEALGVLGHRVCAPELPGYGESTGETTIEDMLDFTLLGWDLVDGLEIASPHLVGHGLGGMVAAEMAAVCPERPASLTLVSPSGLWLDAHPIPDLFAMLPFEFAPLLFHDTMAGAALLTGGLDFSDLEAVTEFFIGNARRLGTAGKVLFPIPNRRLSKRIHRVRTPVALVWGAEDRLHPLVYAEAWRAALSERIEATLHVIEGAGHMVPYELPDDVAAAVAALVEGV